MIAIMNGQRTAHADREFVAFIIGMRTNRWWMTHRCLPRTQAFASITHEFVQQPKWKRLDRAGWFQRTATIIRDCWPFGALATYPTALDRSQVPAWDDFSRKPGNGDTIVSCNETCRIMPGWFENLFANLPALLTGSCTILTDVWHEFATAARQMGSPVGEQNAGLNVSRRKTTNDQFSPHARPLLGSLR